MPDDLLYRDEAYRLIGACLAVHKDKGHGFVEAIYQDALEIELELSGIPFERQRNFSIYYRDLPHKANRGFACHRRKQAGVFALKH